DQVIAVYNFTPAPRMGYRTGVPAPGYYREIFNSDSGLYGGSNLGNAGGVHAEEIARHGRPWSLQLNLPPLGCVMLRRE
ncbi:MAG TPA: alpha amylase C-terminal domain-containing protein, partial [Planctomycetota bacterium]|nr:alpha amylase C-terminal domain-containing protein [Planctomycetota bacterium]